jgi:hypothetical protein
LAPDFQSSRASLPLHEGERSEHEWSTTLGVIRTLGRCARGWRVSTTSLHNRAVDLRSKREMDAFYRWGQRAPLWMIVTTTPLILLAIVMFGPYGHTPAGVPSWLAAPIMAVVFLPAFWMLGVAWVHLVRAQRARRQEALGGATAYRNPVARWIALHGIGTGLVIVVFLLVLTWVTNR